MIDWSMGRDRESPSAGCDSTSCSFQQKCTEIRQDVRHSSNTVTHCRVLIDTKTDLESFFPVFFRTYSRIYLVTTAWWTLWTALHKAASCLIKVRQTDVRYFFFISRNSNIEKAFLEIQSLRLKTIVTCFPLLVTKSYDRENSILAITINETGKFAFWFERDI